MNILLFAFGVVLFTFGMQDVVGLLTNERNASVFSFLQLGQESTYVYLDIILIAGGVMLARRSSEAEKNIKTFLRNVYPSGK